jgi:hypothetical protein
MGSSAFLSVTRDIRQPIDAAAENESDVGKTRGYGPVLSFRMLHTKVSTNRSEGSFRLGIFKAKARPLIGAVHPPVNSTSIRDPGSLGAQQVEVPAEGAHDQAIFLGRRRSPL